MHHVSERRDQRLLAVGSALIALAFVAVLAFAARAQATETLYWSNYGGSPDNVAFANIDGSGGGLLNTGAEEVKSPEGMAYDTVTNRLFVANPGKEQILAINLDGSGATPFTAPGAPIETPEGIAVDPATRTLYWANDKGEGSIAWAKLDGSAGGVLNTTGVAVESPCCRIAIDPVGGRVYWYNNPPSGPGIGYANLDNTGGGGELNLTGSTVKPGGEGLSVDSAAGRVYFLGGSDEIGFANVNGTGGGDVSTSSAVVNGTWGLALDPSIGRLYWGNESNGEERPNAFGFVGTDGTGGGGISIATASVANPQDPLIIKSPSGTGAPAITRDSKNPAALSCSTGSWAADFPGSFVYQAPRSFGYQWALNGAAIAGATAGTFTATAPGAYSCTVTATNQIGSASQTSSTSTAVKAAKVKLVVKPKTAKAKAGKIAKFKVKALNQGDLQTKNAKVCLKVPKKAKKALKAKCKSIGKVGGLKSKKATLKVKLKPLAEGSYKVKIQIKGSAGKAVKATIKVVG